MSIRLRAGRLGALLLPGSMLWASAAASVVELHPSGISPFSTNEAASGSSRKGALSSGRARLEFDLSGLPAGLTAAELVNARLRLWIEEGSRKGTLAARSVTAVRAVVSPTRDAELRLGRAEISRVAVPETAGGSFARLDLTALVRSWLSGEAPNHGVALVASGGGVEVELSGAGGGAERSPVLELEVARELSPSAGDALWSYPTLQTVDGECGYCPAGPEGPQGVQGEVGPEGPAGPPGAKGASLNPIRIGMLRWYEASDTGAVFPVSAHPVSICFDGQNLWVANFSNGSVNKIRATDGQFISSLFPGGNPRGVAFDGAHVWVADITNDRVIKFRARDNANLGTFATGDGPVMPVFDGRNIWVTNFFDGTVTKLRAGDGASLGTFPVGLHPQDAAFDGSSLWVVNTDSDSVSRIRTSDGADLGTFPVGEGPYGIAFDGSSIWVANFEGGSVTRLSAEDGAEIGTFPIGGEPFGVAFDGVDIWVSNKSDNSVIKLRGADGAVLGTFTAGSAPEGVAFDGAAIWVANSQSNSLSKF